jgi:PIN domain nuclease of toxin-antitoxin system
MNYLLDTHYILWILFNPEIIKENIIAILEDENSVKYISGINLWEISLKYSLGKLELEDTNPDEIFEALNNSGFELLEVNNQLYSSYYKLPKKVNHKDPFDRMLIWQAINHDFTLISNDQKIRQYINNGLKLIS